MIDRELDQMAVPLFMDSWPPSIWSVTGSSGGAPTIELTVHWHAVPHTFWHLAWFHSIYCGGGYFAEDGSLWTSDGQLVAQSRQLARLI